MPHLKTEDQAGQTKSAEGLHRRKGISAFFSHSPLDVNHPSLIHFSSTPLFRLEKAPEKYAHLLKKKDIEHVRPIVDYFISNSDHVVYLGGDAVTNLYFRGRKKYRMINILALLTAPDVDHYSWIFNNIISSNDGAFSIGLKYRVKKNRQDGCFKDIACSRYVIEPRLEGPEKLLYPLRSSSIELDLTTRQKFSEAFGVEVR